ncbi:hypothetical protein BD414DRAFT_532908 [Trametes punicea]|nr:hypothetical protein BD414DRAFT_532908 [Trametes punicea]
MASVSKTLSTESRPTLQTAIAAQDETMDGGFLSNILRPGSSLSPTFLVILDGAFALLFLVLLSLFILTWWNVHLLLLMVIECCLWASVKWFVYELRQAQGQDIASSAGTANAPDKSGSKDKAE